MEENQQYAMSPTIYPDFSGTSAVLKAHFNHVVALYTLQLGKPALAGRGTHSETTRGTSKKLFNTFVKNFGKEINSQA